MLRKAILSLALCIICYACSNSDNSDQAIEAGSSLITTEITKTPDTSALSTTDTTEVLEKTLFDNFVSSGDSTKSTTVGESTSLELDVRNCNTVSLELEAKMLVEELYWHCLSRSYRLGQVSDVELQHWIQKLAANDTPEEREGLQQSFYSSQEFLCINTDEATDCENRDALPEIKIPSNVVYSCKKNAIPFIAQGTRRIARIKHVCGNDYPAQHADEE